MGRRNITKNLKFPTFIYKFDAKTKITKPRVFAIKFDRMVLTLIEEVELTGSAGLSVML